jgi:hypothetical protein
MRTCYETVDNPAARRATEAINATFFDDVDQRYGKPIDIADPVRPFATNEHPVRRASREPADAVDAQAGPAADERTAVPDGGSGGGLEPQGAVGGLFRC